MEKRKYMDNKGVTTADLVVAIIIIIMFVSIITTAFYNYYESIQSKNRKTIATNALIDVIENVEMLNYDDVTTEAVNNVITTLTKDGSIQSGYTLTATLQNYNETQGNTDKLDLVKILNVKVEYSIGNKKENIEMKTLITK